MEESKKPATSKEEARALVERLKAAGVPSSLIGPMAMSYSTTGIDKWLAEWEKYKDAEVDESKIDDSLGYSDDYDSTLPEGAINVRLVERVDTSNVSESVRQSIIDEYLCAVQDALDYRLEANRITCPKARDERDRERLRERMRVEKMQLETKLTREDLYK